MGQTLQGATASGLALAGVLVIAGMAAARLGREFPHLGAGAVGAGAAVVAGRLIASHAVVRLAVVLLVAAAAGAAAWWVDRRIATSKSHWWPPTLLAEVGVVALAIGLASLLRLPTAVELPLGVLGGITGHLAAAIAAVVGLAAALAVGTRVLANTPPVLPWVVCAAGTAVAVAVGSGMLPLAGVPALPAFGIPDVVGIAVRAVAVGVVARRGLWWGVAAAVVLGFGESALRATWSLGDVALLAYLAVIVAGLRQVAADRAFAAP